MKKFKKFLLYLTIHKLRFDKMNMQKSGFWVYIFSCPWDNFNIIYIGCQTYILGCSGWMDNQNFRRSLFFAWKQYFSVQSNRNVIWFGAGAETGCLTVCVCGHPGATTFFFFFRSVCAPFWKFLDPPRDILTRRNALWEDQITFSGQQTKWSICSIYIGTKRTWWSNRRDISGKWSSPTHHFTLMSERPRQGRCLLSLIWQAKDKRKTTRGWKW